MTTTSLQVKHGETRAAFDILVLNDHVLKQEIALFEYCSHVSKYCSIHLIFPDDLTNTLLPTD